MKSSYVRSILLIFVLSFLAGCAGGPSSAVSPYGGGPMLPYGTGVGTAHTVTHIVGPSETLWRISKTYSVDIQTLMAVNHLDDPTKIQNGQKLIVPHTLGPRPVIPLYPATRWTYIVVHHTATEDGNAYTIDKIHHKRGFWNGLGYHFLIDNGTDSKTDGQIEVGPRWIKQMNGAHANADGMNERGIGIALVGNFSETDVSRKELDSLVYLVRMLQKYYGIPASHVIGHRDVPGKNTECPGNNFPWAEFKNEILR